MSDAIFLRAYLYLTKVISRAAVAARYRQPPPLVSWPGTGGARNIRLILSGWVIT